MCYNIKTQFFSSTKHTLSRSTTGSVRQAGSYRDWGPSRPGAVNPFITWHSFNLARPQTPRGARVSQGKSPLASFRLQAGSRSAASATTEQQDALLYVCVQDKCQVSVQVQLRCGSEHTHTLMTHSNREVLPSFQNIGRFGFFRFVVFAMYLDIAYV